VVALYGRVFDCPVHPLDVTIRPGMVRLREPVLDPICLADHVEPHWPRYDGVSVSGLLREPDSFFCEDRVDAVGHAEVRHFVLDLSLWSPSSSQ